MNKGFFSTYFFDAIVHHYADLRREKEQGQGDAFHRFHG